ncbi:MAG: glycine--tRNA ligase subunit beta [Planctomycetota bacterium]|nr:MAG: glycine--tRNA ligase subunit beta [Planctomycetota bacterium]
MSPRARSSASRCCARARRRARESATVADLLLEIGVEELPAGYVPGAIAQLAERARTGLAEARLEHGAVHATATPRRLVLAVADLPEAQPPLTEEVAGPPERVAFRDGEPTRAAEGFARKLGLDVAALEVRDTPRGRYVFATRTIPGRPVRELLPELLRAWILALRFPKSMRWPQSPANETFARPVRRLLALLGAEVLPLDVFGCQAGRCTEGHPILAGRRPIALERADYQAYRSLLRQHLVIVEREERRAAIRQAIEARLAEAGGRLEHETLLEEVCDLVEIPHVCEGRFDPRYLELPEAVVEAAMTDHQRYFPVRDGEGRLTARFLFVANQPEPADVVVEGNERVLRARLEDAAFYMREDLKLLMSQREDALAGIVFHERLGTLADKARRLVWLAEHLADQMGLEGHEHEAAVGAARLAKADLTTELVAEFPQLQGVIGGEYLRRQGFPEAVAQAVAEHYRPRFAGDDLPETAAGRCVALADKIDNLVAFFAAGLEPSASADPYALRRQGLGVVRMLIEGGIGIDLDRAVAEAVKALARHGGPIGQSASDTDPSTFDAVGLHARVRRFLEERMAGYLRDLGYRYDLVDAVLGAGGADTSFGDLQRRLEALTALADREGFADLVEVVDRCWRIVRGQQGADDASPDPERFEQPEERALYEALEAVREPFVAACERGAWEEAAELYRQRLAAPVHTFFEKVFVNAPDPAVRANRLALLRAVRSLFTERFADLSRVVEGKK